ncbi:hypothetical protein H2199_004668 [Coniosporium tulheliwenetii]|uniref:Uncharacterized protein n=1 Tax=Coniosporium tulheliwenetii TaxID=3383036 RepID=A0ACC2Z3S3_9PEZI|nr:hypothetical protein H2199_004668 [Cladosporium sp. JES 115]
MAFRPLNDAVQNPRPVPPEKGYTGNRFFEVEAAFAERPELERRIFNSDWLSAVPSQKLIRDISSYIIELIAARDANLAAAQAAGAVPGPPVPITAAISPLPGAAALPEATEPASKKRKLNESLPTQNGTSTATPAWRGPVREVFHSGDDTSFSLPARKKLRFEFVRTTPNSAEGGIRTLDGKGEVQFGVDWKDIDQIFCLPVPDRAKRADNFVVVPYHGNGIEPPPPGQPAPEPIVWTYQGPGAKALKDEGLEEDPEPAKTCHALNEQLRKFGKKVVLPDEKEFASTLVNPSRKGEKVYSVKAHKGSKEGYLYFTSAGILFAFKKPLFYFPFSAIASISYTSILQRTFNLAITTNDTPTSPSQEIEFSMLDQADYTGIDQYIKRHGLNDASLAASRRAQVYNVNVKAEKNGDVANGTANHDEEEESELQKAERMLQDAEDDEEEDYNPGSEGESEGEGSSSEEEEEYGEGNDEGGDGGEDDLVDEELGSEAEDVE